MAMYSVDYDYVLPEFGTLELEIPDGIGEDFREEYAKTEIERMFPDVDDVSIVKLRVLN